MSAALDNPSFLPTAALLAARSSVDTNRLRSLREDTDPGFNAFALMSDTYHRENFHSDVLGAILDVNGKHGMGHQYLHLFLQWLKRVKPALEIEIQHYSGAVAVSREVGHRDITIVSDKHCILIENKINDAHDMHNQIPRYVEKLRGLGKQVDAVLYLTLNQSKNPDTQTWEKNTKKFVNERLVTARAFEGTDKDFLIGWLQPAISATPHIDVQSTLRQYAKIIRHLTQKHMDHQYLDDLLIHLKENPEQADAAQSLRKGMTELNWYISNKIYNHFSSGADKCSPFESIRNYNNYLHYFRNFKVEEFCFNSDIIVDGDLESCTFDFSCRAPEEYEYKEDAPQAVLTASGLADRFVWNGARFVYTFRTTYPNFEEEAIGFITEFLATLRNRQTSIVAALTALRSQKEQSSESD